MGSDGWSAIDLTAPADPATALMNVAILLLQQGIRMLKETVRKDEQVSLSHPCKLAVGDEHRAVLKDESSLAWLVSREASAVRRRLIEA